MRGDSLENRVFANRVLLACLIYAFFALGASIIVEFGMGIQPCRLCKLQRLALAITGVIGAVGYWTYLKTLSFRLAQASLSISIAIAGYHLAVQFGWLADPCIVPKNIESVADFKKMLSSSVPCSQSSWNLFGIPAAGYTAFVSTALAALTFDHIRRRLLLSKLPLNKN